VSSELSAFPKKGGAVPDPRRVKRESSVEATKVLEDSSQAQGKAPASMDPGRVSSTNHSKGKENNKNDKEEKYL